MMKQAPFFVPSPFADLSSTWLSACMQPWAMWQGWTRMWLKSVSTMPSVWLPALAEGRRNQPAAIDFFLPWMPRVDVMVTPRDGHSSEDAMRVMLRAVLPLVGGYGRESLQVDATVTRHKDAAQVRDITPARAVLPVVGSASGGAVVVPANAAAASPAAPKPAAQRTARAKATTAKTPAAKTPAAKTPPRRTRKPTPDANQG